MNQIRTLDGLSDSQSEKRTNQNQERFDPVRIQLRTEVFNGFSVFWNSEWVAGSVNQTVDFGPQMPGANLGMNDSVGTLFVGEK